MDINAELEHTRATTIVTRWVTLTIGRTTRPRGVTRWDHMLPPGPPFTEPPTPPPVDRGAPPMPPPTVLRVLGRYQLGGHVVGESGQPWKYTKTPELVLWLALHGQGSRDEIMEALWPNEPTDIDRFNQTVSDARTKALPPGALPGVSPGGGDPVYRLRGVETDWARFERTATAATGDPHRRRVALLECLRLVDGRPFHTPPGGYDWAAPEAARAQAMVAAIAVEVASEALEAGDPKLAKAAARCGIVAEPDRVDLLTVYGRAALAAQDPAGIAWVTTKLEALGHTLDR